MIYFLLFIIVIQFYFLFRMANYINRITEFLKAFKLLTVKSSTNIINMAIVAIEEREYKILDDITYKIIKEVFN